MGMYVKAWGAYGCFTRPEYKAERVSYDVITPSAAKGLLSSVYWHPGVKYVIDEIYVRSPIRFQTFTKREITDKSSINPTKNNNFYSRGFVDFSEKTTMRSSNILTNVCYYISFHIEIDEMAKKNNGDTSSREEFLNKSYGIFYKRLKKGSYYYPPHFGCCEYPANLEPAEIVEECPSELLGTRYLGRMLKENDYNLSSNKPVFFEAVMKDGCIKL